MSAPESRLIDRHGTGHSTVEVFVLSETRTVKRPRLCRYGGRVKWKVVVAVGAIAGGALWFVRRRSRRAEADAELWAEATDPIARFGDS
jgi:hypothetical protein